jgi:P-type conjugative transfer protein TrbL
MSSFSYADMICQVKGGGVLDNLVAQFGNIAFGWQAQINPLAKKIFFILFGMEFMWQLTIKKVFAGDVEKLWVFFFTRTVLCFFFAKYLVNIELYQGIITYMATLGGRIGAFSLNLHPGSNFPTVGPSEILGNFSCFAESIHRLSESSGAIEYITTKISLAIMEVILFIVLAFIAYCLIKVILETYFLVYAGFLLAGFAGSSWTMSYWQKYFQAISGVAIKFFTICLIMGGLMAQMQSWVSLINAAHSITELAAVVLRVLGTAVIIALIVSQLPEWAAATLAGHVNINLGQSLESISGFMAGFKGLPSAQTTSHATVSKASSSQGGFSPLNNSSASKFGQGLNQFSQGQSDGLRSSNKLNNEKNIFQAAGKTTLGPKQSATARSESNFTAKGRNTASGSFAAGVASKTHNSK